MNDNQPKLSDKDVQDLADILLEYAPKGWQTLFLRYECTAEADIITTWAVTDTEPHAPIGLVEEDADRIRNIVNFALPFDEDDCCAAFQMAVQNYGDIKIEYFPG